MPIDEKDFGVKPIRAKQCRDCALRKDDVTIGDLTISGHDNAYCLIYTQEMGGKPPEVLADKRECEFRVKA